MLLCQVGYNAVSSTGGAGTWKPEWAETFAAVRSIIILYDNDAAGRDGALKGAGDAGRARIATVPGRHQDAGELFANHPAPVSWLYNNVGRSDYDCRLTDGKLCARITTRRLDNPSVV